MRIFGKPTPQEPPKPKTEFKIGTYDESLLFDLDDDVIASKKASFDNKDDAINYAKNRAGVELITERIKPGKGLGFDVYSVRIDDKGQTLRTGKDMENLKLFKNPVKHIEKETQMRTNRAYFVTEDNQVQSNIYAQDFDRTIYDRARAALDLDHNETWWFNMVDKYMTAPSPADDLKDIDRAEIQNMKDKLAPGDIIMTGNNGSFVHAITYVGQDAELQAQLEKKWGLKAGSLNGEGLILHSLAADNDTEVEVDGQKVTRKAGGVGVIIDTIEQYLERHPRDTMIAVEIDGATERDRKAVIEEGKKMLGRGYDNGFNTFDDENIYCTEFIYKSWMAAPDKNPDFATQLHALAPKPSVVGILPFSDKYMNLFDDEEKKQMADEGILRQEMVMTDGIITNPDVKVKWANQNAAKSEFIQKHERWADGYEGKTSKDYKELLMENVPEQAKRSRSIAEQVKTMAARTQAEMAK